jgi:hypothetical protein
MVREYCADCGQRNADLRIPARALAADAMEDGLSLDSRMARTAPAFLLRPGFLTAEWSAGRRARYSSPLRLYLLASAVFFLATGLVGGLGPRWGRGGPLAPGAAGAAEGTEVQDAPDAGDGAAEVQEARARAAEALAPLAGSEEAHRNLREAGWLGRLADDRWRTLGVLSREELSARLDAAFREWIPRVMFFLVPAAALILALLWRRRWLSEHVVLSLHLHAYAFVAFTAMLAARLLPWEGLATALRALLVLSLPVHLLAALRRVYGQGWGRTILKAFAGLLLYLVALGLGLVGVAALALTFA